MSISMASFSPPTTSLSVKPHFTHKSTFFLPLRRPIRFLSTPKSLPDNGAGVSASVAAVDDAKPKQKDPVLEEAVAESAGTNGAATSPGIDVLSKFEDPRWIGGTWDLKLFQKNGSTDWDADINQRTLLRVQQQERRDEEVKRRKWLQDNPETTSNDDPVVFDTSTIPWWAWMKRFHLPEAELLNGRAAMIGFFMAYLVDSLTGVGLVDQMSNFFCKTLLFVAVVGVLLIRKNEDLDNIKKLIEETTFYDKQWQATWQDDTSSENN
ncbi:hypothetical protein QQP08_009947 [Theobroma cacao]|nr:hypothetical protein QQP08_009947 [Theobroma cacao]